MASAALPLCCVMILLSACSRPPRPAVEDLTGRENLSSFTLGQVRGTRDGDSLAAEATFRDGSSTLTVEMRFAIGAPTKLTSGRWQWTRDGSVTSGAVTERSVTFLGGQDSPPSLGGGFNLLSESGAAQYRVNIPLTELKMKLPLDR
jgi:hypothetical protein